MENVRFNDKRIDPFFRVENTLIDHGELSVYEIAVYVALCRYADNRTQECYPSLKTISDKLSISKPTALKYLDSLIEKGYVSKKQNMNENGYNNNIYTIHGVVKEIDKGSKGDLQGVVNDVYQGSKGDLPYKDSLKNTQTNNTNKKVDEKYSIDGDEYKLASLLKDWILKHNEIAKVPTDEHMRSKNGWCHDINKLMRLDGLDYEQVEYLINFSQKHHFWHKNILSAGKLRDQRDRLILEIKSASHKPNNQSADEKVNNATSDLVKEMLAKGSGGDGIGS